MYQAQQVDRVEPDPDYRPVSDVYVRAPRARIVSVVRTDVTLTQREQTLLGPTEH